MDDPEVPIDSVKRSYVIVEEIRERERAGVTELASALELPKTTVHNHLRTLADLDYLVSEGGEYRLASKYLRLGRDCRNGRPVLRHGRAAVEGIAERSNAYGQLVVEENGRATVLLATRRDRDDRLRPIQYPYPVYAHLHTNAPGKAILAHLPTDRTARILDRHGLPGRTDRTVTDEDDLRQELAAIRDRGYAIDRGELIEGMVGVAAPIATDERVYGALAAYGASGEMHPGLDEDLPALVRERAEDVRAEIVFDSPG